MTDSPTLVVLSEQTQLFPLKSSTASACVGAPPNTLLLTPRSAQHRTLSFSLNIRVLKAEAVEAMLHGCATWALRPEAPESLRTAHHTRVPYATGFGLEDHTGHRTLSYRAELEMTNCERIETIIRERQF